MGGEQWIDGQCVALVRAQASGGLSVLVEVAQMYLYLTERWGLAAPPSVHLGTSR